MLHLGCCSSLRSASDERFTLFSTIRSFDSKLLDCTNLGLMQLLLFGNTSQILRNNFKVINASIDYILSSKRFDGALIKMNSLIRKSEFSQQFSFFIYYYFICFIYLFIHFNYFISPGTFQYTGIWPSCNFCFFVYILREVKCKYILIYMYLGIKKLKVILFYKLLFNNYLFKSCFGFEGVLRILSSKISALKNAIK